MSFIQGSLESAEWRGSTHGHFDAVIFSADRYITSSLLGTTISTELRSISESAKLGFETEPDIIRVPSTV